MSKKIVCGSWELAIDNFSESIDVKMNSYTLSITLSREVSDASKLKEVVGSYNSYKGDTLIIFDGEDTVAKFTSFELSKAMSTYFDKSNNRYSLIFNILK